tara:strand:+ start:462 stop:704 length:243 start_codon:yes stop_codon:yes gene_type:complete
LLIKPHCILGGAGCSYSFRDERDPDQLIYGTLFNILQANTLNSCSCNAIRARIYDESYMDPYDEIINTIKDSIKIIMEYS